MRKIEKIVAANPKIRVLDIGSGRSGNFVPLLEKFPKLS